MKDASSSRFGLIRGAVAALLAAAVLAGCKYEDLRTFDGLTEGEYVRVAVPAAGNLSKLSVKRGARVSEGTPVFSLAETGELEAHREATRRLEELEARRGKKGTTPDPQALESLRAEVAQSEWKLAQKAASAPVDGVVTETLFSKGDWVPAGAPVVAILPIDKIKVNFTVPLSVAAHLQHGRSVTLTCERCNKSVEATVTYVSPFAQSDAKGEAVDSLGYVVEVRPLPEQAALLKPGQTVKVHL